MNEKVGIPGQILMLYPFRGGGGSFLYDKGGPRTEIMKIFLMAAKTRNIGIQMNHKELTKTFIMISNSKKKQKKIVCTLNNSAL